MKASEIKVSFRRSRQPQQYESAEASVSLSLIAQDGEEVTQEMLDDAISDALDTVQAHVYERLGLVTQHSKKVAAKTEVISEGEPPAVVATPKATRKATAKKADAPVQEQKAAELAAANDNAPAQEQEALPDVTDGDMIKAIGAVMKRFTAAGNSGASTLITEKIKSYLPDDKPPFSQSRIPQDSRRDFLKDLEDMKP